MTIDPGCQQQIEQDLEFLVNHTIRNNGQNILGCLKQMEGYLKVMRLAMEEFVHGVEKITKGVEK